MTKFFKILKQFFKNFDYFGTTIHFSIKNKYKYHSATSGIFFILFIFILFIYTFINILPFLEKKYMSIIYYNNHIYKTDKINFKNYSFTFAFGIESDGKVNTEEILNNFSLSINYVVLNRTGGIFNKNKTKLNLKFCNESDFYNKHNNSFNNLNLQNLFCLTSYDFEIEGFYSDILYKYFEINMNAKNTDDFNFYKYLTTNTDLKFSLYYTDFSINLNNHKNPEYSFIDGVFIQINPVTLTKQEIFLNLYKFENYENLIFNSHTDSYYLGFSRTHEYIMYKSEERFETKIDDYEKFAKFFIRADTKRCMIERHYMKFTEFIANNIAIFNGLFLLINNLMESFNNFFAYNSIMKKIYIFKEDKKSLNYRQNKIFLEKFKYCQTQKNYFQTNEDYFYNNNSKLDYKLSSYNEFSNCENKSENLILLRSKIINNININFKKQITNSNQTKNKDLIFKCSGIDNISKNKFRTLNTIHLKYKNNKRIELKLKFYFFEFFILRFFPCLMWKKIMLKNSLIKIGKNILFNQIDINNYIKNLQILQIFYYIFLESYQDNFIKILSKPIISCNNKINNNNYINMDNINIKNNDILELNKLFKKINKNKMEKRMMNIIQKNLKDIYEE